MKNSKMLETGMTKFVPVVVVFSILMGADAHAFQEHGPPEGMYIHQLAHVLFALSMAGLWYGIRRSRFAGEPSWRLLATGASLLVLWNVMTLSGHILGHFVIATDLQPVSPQILLAWKFFKLDNIVCVAAMIYFYLGLRSMLHQISTKNSSGQQTA